MSASMCDTFIGERCDSQDPGNGGWADRGRGRGDIDFGEEIDVRFQGASESTNQIDRLAGVVQGKTKTTLREKEHQRKSKLWRRFRRFCLSQHENYTQSYIKGGNNGTVV